jgi:tetratricopeptide (TPR) repeat protein
MKIRLVILMMIFSLNSIAQGQSRQNGDADVLIKDAERFEINLEEKTALEKYKEAFKLQPSNITALNKCSELSARIGNREKADNIREVYYQNAKNYAVEALRIQPENGESNCVMAIALGCIALDASNRQKVDAARGIKKYLDKAITNDPANFKAWHVLGRWHYEMSELNIFERAAVRIIFGGLPHSSLQEAITAYEKANQLKTFAANSYEMARAYKRNDETDKAIAVIQSLINTPNQTQDDEWYKEQGRKLLKEWE